jgi:hypothetical protein
MRQKLRQGPAAGRGKLAGRPNVAVGRGRVRICARRRVAPSHAFEDCAPPLTTIHHRPQVSVSWADRRPAAAGERPRTRLNETQTETRPGFAASRAGRLLGGADLPLFRSKHHCFSAVTLVVSRGQRQSVACDRRFCTGINETRDETTPRFGAGCTSHSPGAIGVEAISRARDPEDDASGIPPAVQAHAGAGRAAKARHVQRRGV